MDNSEKYQKLKNINEKILEAARQSRRQTGKPQLVAVSKGHTTEKIETILKAGHYCFGENKIQETANKWPALRKLYSGIELHCIGPVQSNKVADAVKLFDVIETIDREKIARAFKQEMQKQARDLPCYLQVNIGEEPQKAGIIPKEIPDFLSFCSQELALNIQGLMAIPPANEPPAPYFALLYQYWKKAGLKNLSMGMSQDYEIAIQFGATYVRVGTALFGMREN